MAGEIGFLDRAVALLGGESPEGAGLLPDLVSALIEAGASDRAEALAERAVSVSASLGLVGVHARATIERERMQLSCHPDSFRADGSMIVATRAADTLRSLGDELGLARAAFLMSDLAWLLGDPMASYDNAEVMLTLARRAGSDFTPRRRSPRPCARPPGGEGERRRRRAHAAPPGVAGRVATARGDQSDASLARSSSRRA